MPVNRHEFNYVTLEAVPDLPQHINYSFSTSCHEGNVAMKYEHIAINVQNFIFSLRCCVKEYGLKGR
jgi:hypothetical protein